MTATVIHLPTERLARRGPEASRRRHPAGGVGGDRAPVVPISSNRRFVRVSDADAAQPIPDLTFRPGGGGDWEADAHGVLDRFATLLDVGRSGDLVELCDHAIEHLRQTEFAAADADAVDGLVERLRVLRMAAWRAPQPG